MQFPHPLRIGMILPVPRLSFWAIVGQAAEEHATNLGVTLLPTRLSYATAAGKSAIPSVEALVRQQIAAIRDLARQQVHGLIIPPQDGHDPAFLAALHEARAAGTTIIAIDSPINGRLEACTLMSDNVAGAEAATRLVAEQLQGRGNVVHLQGLMQAQVARDRSDGVHNVLDRAPDMRIVFEASCAWSRADGAQAMRAALAECPDVQAVVAANDEMALGALDVLDKTSRRGRVLVTGFDALPEALFAIRQNRMAATIHRSPEIMGRMAVDLAVQAVQGEAVPAVIRINVALVTADTLTDAALDAVRLFPSVLDHLVKSHEAQQRLQEETIAAQQQVIRKLSSRKQAEEAIRFQAGLLDAVQQAVIAVDPHGIVTYWNRFAATLYGWSSREIVGHDLPLLPPDPPSADVLLKMRRGEPWSGELVAQRRDGSTFPALLTTSPIRDAQGSLLGSVSISVDISEQKQAEDERLKLERKLLEAQKLESLGVLAGGIAHDFNNLLMVMLGNAGLALMELPPESPARESIAHIETTTRRAADLTRQMLAYAGKGRFVVQPLNLNTLIEEMTHLLRVSIPKNVALRYNLAPQLPAVEADATQMRQVMMNLVINAAEAIGTQQGIITLTTGIQWADRAYLAETYLDTNPLEGSYVYLEVSDTGSGMDAATRAKIFDPFFTTKFTGRGLGLAAVLGIVRGHHGSLKVYSEPGRGSTFKFLLPGLDAPVIPEPAHETLLTTWQHSGTILVVDDEGKIRDVAVRILKRFGFTALAAANGQVAIDLLRTHGSEIVCVLLDMTMPHLNGEATFRLMRQIKPDIRVVLMSGYNEQEATSYFAGKGLAGFLAKPFTPYDLHAILTEILSVSDNDSGGQ